MRGWAYQHVQPVLPPNQRLQLPLTLVLSREVGAPKKGLEVWGEEHTHGPAAMASGGLHICHLCTGSKGQGPGERGCIEWLPCKLCGAGLLKFGMVHKAGRQEVRQALKARISWHANWGAEASGSPLQQPGSKGRGAHSRRHGQHPAAPLGQL